MTNDDGIRDVRSPASDGSPGELLARHEPCRGHHGRQPSDHREPPSLIQVVEAAANPPSIGPSTKRCSVAAQLQERRHRTPVRLARTYRSPRVLPEHGRRHQRWLGRCCTAMVPGLLEIAQPCLPDAHISPGVTPAQAAQQAPRRSVRLLGDGACVRQKEFTIAGEQPRCQRGTHFRPHQHAGDLRERRRVCTAKEPLQVVGSRSPVDRPRRYLRSAFQGCRCRAAHRPSMVRQSPLTRRCFALSYSRVRARAGECGGTRAPQHRVARRRQG